VAVQSERRQQCCVPQERSNSPFTPVIIDCVRLAAQEQAKHSRSTRADYYAQSLTYAGTLSATLPGMWR